MRKRAIRKKAKLFAHNWESLFSTWTFKYKQGMTVHICHCFYDCTSSCWEACTFPSSQPEMLNTYMNAS